MGESTKNRFGARIIGIITASNRNDPAIWSALADCDLAELRADGFEPDSIPGEARAFRQECIRRFGRPLETLLTIRLQRDGGAWPDSEAARREDAWQALGLDGKDPACDWVDVEAEEIGAVSAPTRALLASGSARLLLSHHDLKKSLSREGLRDLMRGMQAHKPAGLKFAVTCGSRGEVLDLLVFAREVAAATENGCVLSMGGVGRASRVLAPLLGCPLTYGYLTGGVVAPGQLSAGELRRFFRELPGDLVMDKIEGRWLDWAEARFKGDMLAD